MAFVIVCVTFVLQGSWDRLYSLQSLKYLLFVLLQEKVADLQLEMLKNVVGLSPLRPLDPPALLIHIQVLVQGYQNEPNALKLFSL